MVICNGKKQLVFLLLLSVSGNLNEYLMLRPTLGSSLLQVDLFHLSVTCSGSHWRQWNHVSPSLSPDRWLLFAAVCLTLCQDPLAVHKLQVLPFTTTWSSCCATFVLQHYVINNSQPKDKVGHIVDRCFYTDSCLQVLPTKAKAKHPIDKLSPSEMSWSWALPVSSEPGAISHLCEEIRSDHFGLYRI